MTSTVEGIDSTTCRPTDFSFDIDTSKEKEEGVAIEQGDVEASVPHSPPNCGVVYFNGTRGML